jgi:uncharacterized RDD family membrane protein YckC
MNTNYTEFWRRFLAFIVDMIIIGVIRSFVIVPILLTMGFEISQGIPTDLEDADQMVPFIGMIATLVGIVSIISTIIFVLYYALMESSSRQASIGKMALGLIVTDENGARLDFSKALIRNLCKIISSMILFIGFIMAAFTQKKQALHDIIARTLVVKQ